MRKIHTRYNPYCKLFGPYDCIGEKVTCEECLKLLKYLKKKKYV